MLCSGCLLVITVEVPVSVDVIVVCVTVNSLPVTWSVPDVIVTVEDDPVVVVDAERTLVAVWLVSEVGEEVVFVTGRDVVVVD